MSAGTPETETDKVGTWDAVSVDIVHGVSRYGPAPRWSRSET
jgi:hypothetical protein